MRRAMVFIGGHPVPEMPASAGDRKWNATEAERSIN
jgi:hypothetical protein